MAGVTDARNKYRLSRNFAVACLIVLAVAGAIISKLNVNEAEDRLVEMAEHHNIDLAKVFATALWPRYGALIDSARARRRRGSSVAGDSLTWLRCAEPHARHQ